MSNQLEKPEKYAFTEAEQKSLATTNITSSLLEEWKDLSPNELLIFIANLNGTDLTNLIVFVNAYSADSSNLQRYMKFTERRDIYQNLPESIEIARAMQPLLDPLNWLSLNTGDLQSLQSSDQVDEFLDGIDDSKLDNLLSRVGIIHGVIMKSLPMIAERYNLVSKNQNPAIIALLQSRNKSTDKVDALLFCLNYLKNYTVEQTSLRRDFFDLINKLKIIEESASGQELFQHKFKEEQVKGIHVEPKPIALHDEDGICSCTEQTLSRLNEFELLFINSGLAIIPFSNGSYYYCIPIEDKVTTTGETIEGGVIYGIPAWLEAKIRLKRTFAQSRTISILVDRFITEVSPNIVLQPLRKVGEISLVDRELLKREALVGLALAYYHTENPSRIKLVDKAGFDKRLQEIVANISFPEDMAELQMTSLLIDIIQKMVGINISEVGTQLTETQLMDLDAFLASNFLNEQIFELERMAKANYLNYEVLPLGKFLPDMQNWHASGQSLKSLIIFRNSFNQFLGDLAILGFNQGDPIDSSKFKAKLMQMDKFTFERIKEIAGKVIEGQKSIGRGMDTSSFKFNNVDLEKMNWETFDRKRQEGDFGFMYTFLTFALGSSMIGRSIVATVINLLTSLSKEEAKYSIDKTQNVHFELGRIPVIDAVCHDFEVRIETLNLDNDRRKMLKVKIHGKTVAIIVNSSTGARLLVTDKAIKGEDNTELLAFVKYALPLWLRLKFVVKDIFNSMGGIKGLESVSINGQTDFMDYNPLDIRGHSQNKQVHQNLEYIMNIIRREEVQ